MWSTLIPVIPNSRPDFKATQCPLQRSDPLPLFRMPSSAPFSEAEESPGQRNIYQHAFLAVAAIPLGKDGIAFMESMVYGSFPA